MRKAVKKHETDVSLSALFYQHLNQVNTENQLPRGPLNGDAENLQRKKLFYHIYIYICLLQIYQ